MRRLIGRIDTDNGHGNYGVFTVITLYTIQTVIQMRRGPKDTRGTTFRSTRTGVDKAMN